MSVVLFVGTEKGAWVCRSEDRKTWQVDGPLFKGWKVTCSGRTPGGKYLAGTASRIYGAALQISDDLKEWRQIESGPAYPEGGDRKLIYRIMPLDEFRGPETVASAIRIGDPVSHDKAARVVKRFDGVVEHVSEDELMNAKAMADGAGVAVCPNSGVALAGLRKLRGSGVGYETGPAGETVTIAEALAPGQSGRMSYRGTQLTIVNDSDEAMSAGQRVRISSVDVLKLNLESIKESE